MTSTLPNSPAEMTDILDIHGAAPDPWMEVLLTGIWVGFGLVALALAGLVLWFLWKKFFAAKRQLTPYEQAQQVLTSLRQDALTLQSPSDFYLRLTEAWKRFVSATTAADWNDKTTEEIAANPAELALVFPAQADVQQHVDFLRRSDGIKFAQYPVAAEQAVRDVETVARWIQDLQARRSAQPAAGGRR